jgi:hypothetical protein
MGERKMKYEFYDPYFKNEYWTEFLRMCVHYELDGMLRRMRRIV